jgi:hypothetical protein
MGSPCTIGTWTKLVFFPLTLELVLKKPPQTSAIIRKNYCFLLDFPFHQFIELHRDSLLDGLTHHFSSVFYGSTAFVHANSKWVSTSLARSQPCGRWRWHHLAMEEPDAVPRADAPGTMAKLMNITPMAHNYGL